MKKSRIFMGCGALALAIAGILSVKATKKFTGVKSFYINTGTWQTVMIQGTANALFTVSSSGAHLATFLDGSGGSYTMYATAGTSTPVYTKVF